MSRRRKGNKVDGIVLVDKPEGLSSNAVVQRVKRFFNAQKAGHTGALDPLATGMLPVCLGEATKFSQFSLDADKAYRTTAILGVRTDTSDADGDVVSVKENTSTEEEIVTALASFRGQTKQTPSPFSALKYEGKPLYYYARKGIDVPRPTRDINVHHIELLGTESNVEKDVLDIEIHCSKGTYIRTIIDDLGQMLGCGAHVAKLRRLWVSGFNNLQMHSLEDIEDRCNALDNDAVNDILLPIDVHLAHIPIVYLDDAQSDAFLHGMSVTANVPLHDDMDVFRMYSENTNTMLGIATKQGGNTLQPKRVVVTE